MLFNSFSFLIFFPAVVVAYFSVPKRFQSALLLLASCYFYMAFVPQYILILFFLITVDFFAAQAIEKRIGEKRKKILWLSISANLGMLFIFKYFDFFNVNIASFAHFLHWNYSPLLLSIVLPLGLSFHIFQSLSYVIEVYRGKYPVEKNFLTYALYVMFFPQMVAGPIERPQHFLPQLKNDHQFDPHKARMGLERMLWGFFKKLVIADQLALVVNGLFAHLPTDGLSLIFLIFLFSYQIYCDFSGYSDIAIGSALVLGYDLSENFNRPYASRSISEFWRRWHISLSSWLRDYLYYSLVFSVKKKTELKMYWALFVTFLCSGLWHGANWTFVIWGAIHGMYLIVGSATKKIRDRLSEYIGLSKFPKLHHTLQVIVVFILVSFSFIFFRSENLKQAMQIILHLGNGMWSIFTFDEKSFGLLKNNFDLTGKTQMVKYFMIVVMEIVQYFQARKNTFYIFDDKPKAVRYLWYYALIFILLIFGYYGKTTFIYFQF
jgi:D-alanyl-lipoteichoic acid acyltransferase DltB (MBOAT superfamily)